MNSADKTVNNKFNEELINFIRIQVLLNAKLYNGKPNPKAVLGKILGIKRELRSQALELKTVIETIVAEILQLSLHEISEELNKLAPEEELKHKKRKTEKSMSRIQQKQELPELKNVVDGKFVVRYAPDPSKYPHLGQGMSYLINRMYADKYNGKVILRFDDTNPAIVAPEYYEAIKEGLLWLNATWDEEVYASSLIEEFYSISQKLIDDEKFYVCTCSPDNLSKNRKEGIACNHRENSVNVNSTQYSDMIAGKYKPSEAVVRLLGNMSSNNLVMRDPIMLRLVRDKHPLLAKFYNVFPTYDFESAYIENKFGITHVIRSGEFGLMRQELQSQIISLLGGKIPEFVSFGRFNIQGSPTKGRVIRELVENNVVSGWDDIRLLTLSGLRKRGIHPGTAKLLIQEAGLTPKNTHIAWKTLEAKSKSLLEPQAKRFFFVPKAIKLIVHNSPQKKISLPLHPDHPEYGSREFTIDGNFYLSTNDTIKMKKGTLFRLKDLFNVEVEEISSKIIKAHYVGEALISSAAKIQWVTNNNIPGTLIIPDLLEKQKGKINENSLSSVNGLFEEAIKNVSEEDIVQLERFGYAKLSVGQDKITGHIVHLH